MPGVPPASYGYLGPEGTFTEQALRTVPAAGRAELTAYPSVAAALDAVRSAEVTSALVPIENSVEGSVSVTLDELSRGEPLMITREVLLPVRFALLARAGTTLADVRRVLTHPHAEAQTRKWVRESLPEATVAFSDSTAGAAQIVSDPDSAYDAAIAARIAGEKNRLQVLADDIGDADEAVTRFVLVARPAAPAPPTGRDKTSLAAFIRDEHPGALMEILEQFHVRGINLTRLESRPTGNGQVPYWFSIDAEGHLDDARLGEALLGLRRVCADVRYLGSYARADEAEPTVRIGTSERDFVDADAWLRGLRSL